VLRFLIASREEVSSVQLRDDLLSMLVAGHETTGSVLTWTVDLLARNPETLRKVGGGLECGAGGAVCVQLRGAWLGV
jgi:carotene epsilon-monooxygenase